MTHLTRGTHTTNVRLMLTARHPSISIVANLVGTGVPAHVTFAMSDGVSSHAVLSRTNTRSLLNVKSVLCSKPGSALPMHIRNTFIHSRRIRTIIRS